MRRRIREAIDRVEAAETLDELPNLTKLSGASSFYRIRVGDHRSMGKCLNVYELEGPNA